MAVISDGKGDRFLVGLGDPIFRGRDPYPVGVVQSVTPVVLFITLTEGGQVVRALPGRPIPGIRELGLVETVLVKTLEYRQRTLDRGSRKILDGEQYLVGLYGARAVLQRDTDPGSSPAAFIAPLPSPTEVMEKRLAAVRIVETGPGTWDVNAKDVHTAMESGEAIINRMLSESRLDISREQGIGLEVKTPLADVRVDRRGFLITSPNLASRAGLQVGDRILGVNGMPIDGLLGLVQAYRRIRDDASLRVVNLAIERNQQPLTFTYRIR
jgi:hypothetical protein